jgi:hypothetical protein
MNRRFGSLGRAELFRAQLKNRIKGNHESISELAQSIKKLTRLAYPTTDQSMLNILSVDQFIDALPDPGLRLRLREANPRDINEAEILAIRLETHRMADAQRSSSLQLMNPYENNFKSLRDELHAIKTIVLNNQNPKPYHQSQSQMHPQSPNPNFSYSESHRVEAPDYKFRSKQKQNKPKYNNQNMNWNHSRNPNTPMSDHSRPNVPNVEFKGRKSTDKRDRPQPFPIKTEIFPDDVRKNMQDNLIINEEKDENKETHSIPNINQPKEITVGDVREDDDGIYVKGSIENID